MGRGKRGAEAAPKYQKPNSTGLDRVSCLPISSSDLARSGRALPADGDGNNTISTHVCINTLGALHPTPSTANLGRGHTYSYVQGHVHPSPSRSSSATHAHRRLACICCWSRTGYSRRTPTTRLVLRLSTSFPSLANHYPQYLHFRSSYTRSFSLAFPLSFSPSSLHRIDCNSLHSPRTLIVKSYARLANLRPYSSDCLYLAPQFHMHSRCCDLSCCQRRRRCCLTAF